MTLSEAQIKELANIFDDIITSESQSVQSAFQRLALLSSLAKQDREEPGPFTQLFNRLEWLERELVDLRRDVQIVGNGGKLHISPIETVAVNIAHAGTGAGGYTYQTTAGSANNISIGQIAPLTMNDITVVDLSTITLTDLDK